MHPSKAAPVVLTVLEVASGAARGAPAAGSPSVPRGLAAERSTVRGVYPVIRKWQRGVGMRDATSPSRSLFM